MDWIEGPPLKKPVIDWNRKFLEELKGELGEDQARITLGQFLAYNIGMTVRMLTGFKLGGLQKITIKGWMAKNYTMSIEGRGMGKTTKFSHFAYLFCLLNPGKHIVVVAPTFRSSRRVLENIDDWSRRRARPGDPGGALLRQTFAKDMVKKADMYRIEFLNGSTITALPLGDPDRLRGFRCSVLAVDEALMIPQVTLDNVLKPFLFAVPPDEIMRRQRIRERENTLIKEGKLKEEDRIQFDSQAKMILLSSASYAWQDLFELFKKYVKIIKSQDPEFAEETKDSKELPEKTNTTYLVYQLPYQLADQDFVDKSAREEIESGMYSESTVAREFGAQFVQDSDGYFRAAKMQMCTIEDGKEPCVEIVGEKNAKYVLAIDQNVSDSETADHFAMCVSKIVEKNNSDGSKEEVGLVVHQYAEVGVPLREHIEYLYYLLTHFNIVYIGYDASQGKNLGFINICNESELFKAKKISLKHIIADFGTDNEEDIIKQVRRGYNLDNRMIVQPQAFHSTFQRAANEHLQACFDSKRILFAAKARANGAVFNSLLTKDVGDILRKHSSFQNPDIPGEPGEKDEFIVQQDVLMDLVKKECALIEVKISSLGNLSYDLPQNMKRGNKKVSRLRRDSYTALLLNTWCLRIYKRAMELPQEETESEGFAALM